MTQSFPSSNPNTVQTVKNHNKLKQLIKFEESDTINIQKKNNDI
jgi:hypothetical protein